MSTEVEPLANSWYRDVDSEEEFLVIEVDEDEGLVEIQYRDGEIEQIELDTWSEMDLESVEEPEDWEDPDDEDEEEEEEEEDWDDDDLDEDEDEEDDEDEDEDEDEDFDDDDDYDDDDDED